MSENNYSETKIKTGKRMIILNGFTYVKNEDLTKGKTSFACTKRGKNDVFYKAKFIIEDDKVIENCLNTHMSQILLLVMLLY